MAGTGCGACPHISQKIVGKGLFFTVSADFGRLMIINLEFATFSDTL